MPLDDDIEKPVTAGNIEMEWASDVMAEMVRRLDLKYLAMNPGASYRGFHDSLVNYLGNRDPQMLVCLNEDHAVAIAHGYARVTGEPMGCVLHSNVGLMHGLMQVFNAWCARVPIILIGATGPVAAEQRRPWVDWVHTAKDQGALLRQFTKWDDQPTSLPSVVESFLRANQIARTAPKGPVYVCLEADLQETPVETADLVLPDLDRYQPGPSPHPSAATLADIAERLIKAKRPIILAGNVSRDEAAWQQRVRLAEAVGALVLSDLRTGASFPTDHPLHGPFPRSHYGAEAAELVRQADVVLVLNSIDLAGAISLIETKGPLGAYIINCSVDSYVHNGWSMDYQGLPAVDLRVLAEPDSLVEGLLPLVEAKPRATAKWPAASLTPPPPDLSDPDRAITQADLAWMLNARRSGRRFTLVRVGLGFASEHYHFREPLDYLGFDGGGGLGAGPGMAVGAGLALKDSGRIPITIIGDGDFLQGATSLWTAAHYQIPVLVIVANNRSNFNDEIHQAEVARKRRRPVENKWIGMRLTNPTVDLASLSRSQGVDAEGPVETIGALAGALDRALAAVESGRPYLLDMIMEPSDRGPLLKRGG
jgi:thiamine pyrophosphate-dependent acetolactate synthase large subunit-like protein